MSASHLVHRELRAEADLGLRAFARLRARSFLAWIAFAGVLVGCAGTGGGATTPDSPPVVSPSVRDVLPPCTVEVGWASPAEQWAEPPWSTVLQAALPDDVADRLERRFTLRPADVRKAIWAGCPDSSVLLLEVRDRAEDRVRAMATRMALREGTSDAPVVRAVGFVGEERWDLAAMGPTFLAFGFEGPEAMSEVLAVARGEIDGIDAGGTAFRSAMGYRRFVPLPLPEETEIGALLAGHRALAVEARPESEDIVSVAIRIIGEMPATIVENTLAVWESLRTAALGRLLGLADEGTEIAVRRSERGLAVDLSLHARPLAAGLRALLRAELAEILDEGARSDVASD